MFAVIKTGGKQYKVMPGDLITVERLEGEAGSKVNINDILMIGDEKASTIGTPFVEKSEVKAMIVDQGRSDKVIVFKKKRRQNYRRKAGHRQHLTCLWIEDIVVNGKSHPAENKIEPRAAAKKEEAPKKAAPSKKASVEASAEKPAPKAKTAPKAETAEKAAPKAETAEKATKAAPKAAAKSAEKKPAAKTTK